jgi:hypothetical protein
MPDFCLHGKKIPFPAKSTQQSAFSNQPDQNTPGGSFWAHGSVEPVVRAFTPAQRHAAEI